MKVAIMYLPRPSKLESAAKHLGHVLEGEGHRVDYFVIGPTDRAPSFRQYDFVYLGSLTEGFFGGKVPTAVTEYVKQCRGLENAKSAAFILNRLIGSGKGLRKVMAVLENMGSMVMDFQVIRSQADTERLGKRLNKIQP